MNKGDAVGLVLAAAGSGRRFGSPVPKQFLRLDGVPVYRKALDCFRSQVDAFVVVVPADRVAEVAAELDGYTEQPLRVVPGGDTRQESVRRGVRALGPEVGWVLVHDAARPWVSADLVGAVIAAMRRVGACIPAVEVSETVKEVEGGYVLRTLDRGRLRLAQTPQGFSRELLESALEEAQAAGIVATDEAMLLERRGCPVAVVPGDPRNVKITWESDFPRTESREEKERPGREGGEMRVGLGFDFHPLVPNRPLVLGGVTVPGDLGLAGHSDADALLHAVADALLGAAGLSDIGSYFPDTDPRWAGVSSLLLLEKVYRLVRGRGFRVVNVDVVVMAEYPRVRPHVPAIKANLARVLYLRPEEIGVKATTLEGKGAVGRKEGVAVQAVVLLRKEER
ncbi:MAG: bifunctional 2-C-methyl-D-erythritol 4-phosphate cytidylyltransferase/2-C-methyl-D-erythritol 2,4-cyclodiphosphate synthase [Acidobacteriota bacterium]